jgi:hypothetical protein
VACARSVYGIARPQRGTDSAAAAHLPQIGLKSERLAAKKTQPRCRNAGCESMSGIMTNFDDNEVSEIVTFAAQ